MDTLRIALGKTVSLNCSVDSNPAANITILTPSGNIAYISSDGIFTISNITRENAGTYVCTASNSLGVTMLNYTVDVLCKLLLLLVNLSIFHTCIDCTYMYVSVSMSCKHYKDVLLIEKIK